MHVPPSPLSPACMPHPCRTTLFTPCLSSRSRWLRGSAITGIPSRETSAIQTQPSQPSYARACSGCVWMHAVLYVCVCVCSGCVCGYACSVVCVCVQRLCAWMCIQLAVLYVCVQRLCVWMCMQHAVLYVCATVHACSALDCRQPSCGCICVHSPGCML